jgi:type I restriction enzyme S subunit
MNDLPSRWVVATGKDLFDLVTSGSRGWARYYSPTGAKFIRIGNLQRQSIALDLEDIQRVSLPSTVEGQRTRLQAGDILVSITAELGLVGLVGEGLGEAYVNQHIALVRPSFNEFTPYVARYLISPEGQASIGAANRGVTRAGLGLDDIRALGVRLPPLAEQRRIVAKIDSLSAKSRRARNQLDDVARLVEKYKLAILAAAFRGDLTHNWRMRNRDSSGASLVEELMSSRLDRRRSKMLTRNLIEPDRLPSAWAVARIEDVCSEVVDGTHHTPDYIPSGVPFISVKDIRNGAIDFSDCKYISDEEHVELSRRCNPTPGDLLVTKSGTIGRCAVVERGAPTFSLFVSVALIRPASDRLRSKFLEHVLHYWISTIDTGSEITGTAIKNLHLQDIKALGVPIPPTAEQDFSYRSTRPSFGLIASPLKQPAPAS